MIDSSNSWVTLDYANNYFRNKYGASFWESLSNTDKEKLLITAKNFILQMGYSIPDDSTEEEVKKAQCETVQWYYEFYEQWK